MKRARKLNQSETKALTPARKLKVLQAKFPFRFKSRLSQHFLVDPHALDGIVRAAGIARGDTVIEVGAGAGFLTERLLATGANVIAIEIDPDMIALLKRNIGFAPRLKVIEADILEVDLKKVMDEAGAASCAVVGNLPYHISTPALFYLLEARHKPGNILRRERDRAGSSPAGMIDQEQESDDDIYRRSAASGGWRERVSRMVFTLQREVGLRMVAGPGTKVYGSISVAVEYLSRCEKLFEIGAGAFVPPPEVKSVVMRLTPVPARLSPELEWAFFSLMRAAFGQRRKMILNAVSDVSGGKVEAATLIERAGIAGTRRGETLSVGEFIRLAEAWGEVAK